MIALDANGADNGPATVAAGRPRVRRARAIFGPPPEIGGAGATSSTPRCHHATTTSPPARSARRPDASIVQATPAVAEGRADALVSAGPTGAALAAAMLHLKRIKGVHRPAVAVLLPVPGSPR